jgi:hypothetical protein
VTFAIVAVAVTALVVGAIWASAHVAHPEQAASHGEAETRTTSDRLYRGSDRPAGPDAETTMGTGARRHDPPPPA